MAVFELTFRAETLDFDQNVTVLLPEPENLALAETGKPFRGELPVLYLLHGYSDDHTSWLRRSSIERYLTMDSTRPLICVCPSVQNSFYTDMEYGWKYYTYLTEELPRLLSRWIRISSKPEDTFIAGLSMGGYGAYKIALSHRALCRRGQFFWRVGHRQERPGQPRPGRRGLQCLWQELQRACRHAA